MSAPRLPDSTRMGPVRLAVHDLDASVAFYERALGFRVHRRDARHAELGADDVLLALDAAPDAPPRPTRTSGLFHVAYLVPTRRDLATWLRHAVDAGIPLEGASDHLVSEAIYLSDPDGNGIEVYRDRPREEWPFTQGRLGMATLPLRIHDLLTEAEDWSGHSAGGTRVGHVHLNVGDVAQAESFYRDRVGFDLMARYGEQASFVSAGGYHHHVAFNTWTGRGAPPAPEGSLGLREYTVELAEPADLDALARRIPDANDERGALHARDPSGNAVRFVAP